MSKVEEVIEKFGLQPHPKEGGYFFETYRNEESIPADTLPHSYGGPKNHSTKTC